MVAGAGIIIISTKKMVVSSPGTDEEMEAARGSSTRVSYHTWEVAPLNLNPHSPSPDPTLRTKYPWS